VNVLLISPAYPGEMPLFAAGLARVGARVIGLGDQPDAALPPSLRPVLSRYLRVPRLLDQDSTVGAVVRATARLRIDRIECLWEPGMYLAARLREALGVPGLDVAATVPFRDKEAMKRVLDGAGIRTPRHARAAGQAGIREAAERLGVWPLIVKPIAGGGSADTYRLDDPAELERTMPRLRALPEVSVEEYIDGEEFTYDTICAGGRVLYDNVAWYSPRPLIEKQVESVSPTTVCLRRIDAPLLTEGREMGRAVLRAMGFDSGFTHMEWFRKPDGEVVFGEIAARPPGARTVDAMNVAGDVDLFGGWAEAVCHGRLSQPARRPYNAAVVCTRSRGAGTRIARIEGLERARATLGRWLAVAELSPPGSPRRDWRLTSLGDGFLIVRHPELRTTLRMARWVAREVRSIAG